MLAVGVLLIALGVVFLAVPLEQLQKVFRRMRSRIGTKIGGAVLVVISSRPSRCIFWL